ncbi:F-box domain-containing protein [Pleurotus pulmonarius]
MGSGPSLFQLYDSRASAYLKIGNIGAALLDAKSVIELAPEQWQGYYRAAQGFLRSIKLDKAKYMLNKAREKVGTGDESSRKRMSDFDALEKEIGAAERTESTPGSSSDLKTTRFLDRSSGTQVSSSFSKLPWELIVAIFLEATSTPSHTPPFDAGPTSMTHVLHLTWVCKSWRRIAHSTPPLWRRLILTGDRAEKKAQYWIGLARGKIQELILKKSFLEGAETSRFAGKAQSLHHYILKKVLKHMKWDVLRSFTMEDWSNHRRLLYNEGTLSRVLPQLESLAMSNEASEPVPWITVIAALSATPRIAFVKTNSTPADDHDATSRIRHLLLEGGFLTYESLLNSGINSLRTLRLRKVSLSGDSALIKVLESNPELETLELDTRSQFRVTTTGPPSSHPLLRSSLVYVSLTGPIDVPKLFDSVDFPNLRMLKIGHNSTSISPALRVMSQRASESPLPNDETPCSGGCASLEELRISSCVFEPTDLVSFLGWCPSLRVLEVSRCGLEMAPILESLVRVSATTSASSGPEMTMLCPALTELNVSHSSQVTTGPVVRLVKARLDGGDVSLSHPVAAIERLTMDGCLRIEYSALPWLRARVKTLSCVFADRKSAGYKR